MKNHTTNSNKLAESSSITAVVIAILVILVLVVSIIIFVQTGEGPFNFLRSTADGLNQSQNDCYINPSGCTLGILGFFIRASTRSKTIVNAKLGGMTRVFKKR